MPLRNFLRALPNSLKLPVTVAHPAVVPWVVGRGVFVVLFVFWVVVLWFSCWFCGRVGLDSGDEKGLVQSGIQ